MFKAKTLSVLFAALILGLGAGCASAEEMGSSMEGSEEAAMSGSMDDGMSESGATMGNSGDSGMSESMSGDGSDMSGDMADGDASMDESDSMEGN